VRFFQDEATHPSATAETMVIAWPYTDLRPARGILPPNAVIAPRVGSLYRNDFEPQAAPLYYVYAARPLPDPRPTPAAEFETGIILQSAAVLAAPGRIQVRLGWSASAPVRDDVHVFVHLRNGDTIVAQDDAPLGSAVYPAKDWRAGDWVEETHPVNGDIAPGLRLFVGLYRYPTGERLTLPDGADAMELALP
jgi:hypothetical protein